MFSTYEESDDFLNALNMAIRFVTIVTKILTDITTNQQGQNSPIVFSVNFFYFVDVYRHLDVRSNLSL